MYFPVQVTLVWMYSLHCVLLSSDERKMNIFNLLEKSNKSKHHIKTENAYKTRKTSVQI